MASANSEVLYKQKEKNAGFVLQKLLFHTNNKNKLTSLSRNLSSKSSLSFSRELSFNLRLDTSDISSSFWVSRAALHRSSYNQRLKKKH